MRKFISKAKMIFFIAGAVSAAAAAVATTLGFIAVLVLMAASEWHWEIPIIFAFCVAAGVITFRSSREVQATTFVFTAGIWIMFLGFTSTTEPNLIGHFAGIFADEKGAVSRYYTWFVAEFFTLPFESCSIGFVLAEFRRFVRKRNEENISHVEKVLRSIADTPPRRR